jgi:hypothetical protein
MAVAASDGGGTFSIGALVPIRKADDPSNCHKNDIYNYHIAPSI